MAMHDQYLDTGAVRLRYRFKGVGPAVVLLHGWTLDLDMWAPQFEALSVRYRIIALDRRGFGLSSGSPDIEGDLHDVHALLDALDVQRAAIVGMSQGARVALAWAARFPQRSAALVLDGPPDDGLLQDASSEIPIEEYRALVRSAGIAAFRRAWLQHPLMQLTTNDPHARVLLESIVARYPGRDLLGEEFVGVAADLAVDVHVTTLIINGEADTSQRRAAGEALANRIAYAQHVLIPHAGHLPNLDNPSAYNHAIDSFLSRELISSDDDQHPLESR